MLKTIIEKIGKKNIITWTLIWLNWSITKINITLKFLNIYIYIYIYIEREREREKRMRIRRDKNKGR